MSSKVNGDTHPPEGKKHRGVPSEYKGGKRFRDGELEGPSGGRTAAPPGPSPLPTLPGFFSSDPPELSVGIKMCS